MNTYFVLELDMKINETHTENDNRQNEIELENGIIFKYFFLYTNLTDKINI